MPEKEELIKALAEIYMNTLEIMRLQRISLNEIVKAIERLKNDTWQGN